MKWTKLDVTWETDSLIMISYFVPAARSFFISIFHFLNKNSHLDVSLPSAGTITLLELHSGLTAGASFRLEKRKTVSNCQEMSSSDNDHPTK